MVVVSRRAGVPDQGRSANSPLRSRLVGQVLCGIYPTGFASISASVRSIPIACLAILWPYLLVAAPKPGWRLRIVGNVQVVSWFPFSAR